MDGAAPIVPRLLPDLLLYILSQLPPNERNLYARSSCKEFAELCGMLTPPLVLLSKELPEIPNGSILAAYMRNWPLRHQVRALVAAVKSGIEGNVRVVMQALEPRLFPELLQSTHYGSLLQLHIGEALRLSTERNPVPDVGSAAVVSGLVRLLPYLEQRCPGLLDPGSTLEAAARCCDLSGLQAVWELLGQRLLSSLQHDEPTLQEPIDDLHEVWRHMLAAAAGSPTPDAMAKMQWVMQTGQPRSRTPMVHAVIWGAAAGSGDMARLQWLRGQGCPWDTRCAVQSVLKHVDLPFLSSMESAGHLPPASHPSWADVAPAAAGSRKDSTGKLQWLAARGVVVGTWRAAEEAAECGNLAALQLLMPLWMQADLDHGRRVRRVSIAAAGSGHVPTAAWLTQQMGMPVVAQQLYDACYCGDLPMVRWLLEAGHPADYLIPAHTVDLWPNRNPADGQHLLGVMQLQAEALGPQALTKRAWEAAVHKGYPWPVLKVLQELVPAGAWDVPVPFEVSMGAAATGCEAVVEALVGLGALEGRQGADVAVAWYAGAAKNGDRGMLDCLVRLGVPRGEGVLAAAAQAGAPLPALRWLVEELGVPLGEGVLAAAVRAGAPLPTLRWLVEEQGAPVLAAEVLGVLDNLEEYYRRVQERGQVEEWLHGL